MTDLQPWQTLHSELIVSHRHYSLRRDTVKLPSGLVMDDYFVCPSHDVALSMPVTSDRQVILVRQYRHAVQKILVEFPAGRFDLTSELPPVAAYRELLEETGYGIVGTNQDHKHKASDTLIPLAMLHDNPGRDTGQLFVFLAYPVQPIALPCLDESEDIEIIKIPLEQLLNWILQGDIFVSGTVAASLLGLNWFRSQGLL
jgi:8-oxo-dGTP pyrophosphatase MutT (NUDIX family)